jgi:hypothetical protein
MLYYENIDDFANRYSSDPRVRAVLSTALRKIFPDPANPIFDPNVTNRIESISRWIVHGFRSGADWTLDTDASGLPKSISSATHIEDLFSLSEAAEKKNGSPLVPPFADGDEEETYDFGDGFRAVRLKTREAVSRERASLAALPLLDGVFEDGDIESGKGSYIAIRDASDRTVAMMAINRLAVCDVVGFRRYPLERAFVRSYVMDYVSEFGLAPMEVSSIPGMVLATDGMIYDICELPDGVTIDGDLRIYDKCPELERLPDNMTVNGQFILHANNRITEVPKNFTATDGMGFTKCEALTTVRSGVSSPEWSSFSGSRRLAVFEDGCSFPAGVELPRTPEMMRAFPMFSDRGKNMISVEMKPVSMVPRELSIFAGKVARAATAVNEVASAFESVVRSKLPALPRRRNTSGTSALGSVLEDHRREREERLLDSQARMDAEIERRTAMSAKPPASYSTR